MAAVALCPARVAGEVAGALGLGRRARARRGGKLGGEPRGCDGGGRASVVVKGTDHVADVGVFSVEEIGKGGDVGNALRFEIVDAIRQVIGGENAGGKGASSVAAGETVVGAARAVVARARCHIINAAKDADKDLQSGY